MSAPRLPVAMRSTVTAEARGSQAAVVVLAIAGLILVLAGLSLAAVGKSGPGYIGISIGFLCLWGSYRMWHRAQPDVDRRVPPRADIAISRGEVRVRGSEAFVGRAANWKAIAHIVSRLAHQEPLPPAAGVVEIVDGKSVVRTFTAEEAAADAEALRARVEEDQRHLFEAMQPLVGPRVALPDRQGVTAPPKEVSGERPVAAIPAEAQEAARRRRRER